MTLQTNHPSIHPFREQTNKHGARQPRTAALVTFASTGIIAIRTCLNWTPAAACPIRLCDAMQDHFPWPIRHAISVLPREAVHAHTCHRPRARKALCSNELFVSIPVLLRWFPRAFVVKIVRIVRVDKVCSAQPRAPCSMPTQTIPFTTRIE